MRNSMLVAAMTAAVIAGLSVAQELPQPRPKIPLPSKPAKPQPGPGGGKTADQLVKIRSMSDVERVGPGQKFHLAFIFDIEPQWHIYWKNPGASGGPTKIEVIAPSQFAIGKTLFPRPEAFDGEEGETFGYQNQVVIFVEVQAPIELMPSHAAFTAKIDFMVCKDICLIGRSRQMVSVSTDPNAAPREPGAPERPGFPTIGGVDPVIAQFKKHLPQPLEDLSGAEMNFNGTNLKIKLPAQGKNAARFFPMELPGVTYGQQTVTVEGSLMYLSVPVTVNPGDAQGKPMMIAGLVGLGNDQKDPSYELEIPVSQM